MNCYVLVSLVVMVDVGFLLDSSGSIVDHYQEEKEFLKKLAEYLGVGTNRGRGSVITFSLRTDFSIKLNDYNNLTLFNEAVDNIPHMHSWTRIDRALRAAQSDMFTPSAGSREGVPKILVLLTDGEQTTHKGAYEDPSMIAKEIREQGINMLVVGMGTGINFAELESIAGTSDLVFTADTFEELISVPFVRRVASSSCDVGKSSFI